MTYKFRPHRGSLGDAMKEVQEFKDFEDLLEYIRKMVDFDHVEVSEKTVKVKWYAKDDRINWDTYIVTLKGWGPVGFTDSIPPIKVCSLNTDRVIITLEEMRDCMKGDVNQWEGALNALIHKKGQKCWGTNYYGMAAVIHERQRHHTHEALVFFNPVVEHEKVCLLDHETILELNRHQQRQAKTDQMAFAQSAHFEWTQCPECKKELE